MTTHSKEVIQYGTALAMVGSGIVLAFLSFFLNNYDIADGVLWYIAQALTYAGAIFGVSVYFKTKLGEFESRTRQELRDLMGKEQEKGDEENEDTTQG